MEFLHGIPIWALALLIFAFRITDVSIGTVRAIFVINNQILVSAILGFFEVLIWIIAVGQVISRVNESFILVIAYAGGFGAGNALGIWIESRIAFGVSVLRIISMKKGKEISVLLRKCGQGVTTFEGEGRDGPVMEVYCSCPRKQVRKLIDAALEIDPDLFFVVERANEQRHTQTRRKRHFGLRGIMNRK